MDNLQEDWTHCPALRGGLGSISCSLEGARTSAHQAQEGLSEVEALTVFLVSQTAGSALDLHSVVFLDFSVTETVSLRW